MHWKENIWSLFSPSSPKFQSYLRSWPTHLTCFDQSPWNDYISKSCRQSKHAFCCSWQAVIVITSFWKHYRKYLCWNLSRGKAPAPGTSCQDYTCMWEVVFFFLFFLFLGEGAEVGHVSAWSELRRQNVQARFEEISQTDSPESGTSSSASWATNVNTPWLNVDLMTGVRTMARNL